MGNHDTAFRCQRVRPHRRARGPSAAAPVLILLAVTLPLLLPGRGLAEPSDGWDAVETLEASHRDALVELFKWCRRTRLNQTSDEVAKELLSLDPDHGSARRWLGFKRRDGEWQPPERPKTRRNWNRSAIEKYPARRAALVGGLVGDYWRVYERLQVLGPDDARRHLLRRAVEHWPTDPRFRTAAGETRKQDGWILNESARSPAMQRRLRRSALRLVETAPLPDLCETPAVLRGLEFDSRGACTCEGIAVASGTSQTEAIIVARHCVAAEDLFQLVFDVETTLPEGYTVALGTGRSALQKMVTQLELPERVDKRYRKLGGFYLEELHVDFNSAGDSTYRLECSVRRVMSVLIRSTFGNSGRLGWPGEGLAAYLTWLICRTHLVSYSRMPEYSEQNDGGRTSGERPTYGWLTAARRLASEDTLPELRYIVSVNLNDMVREDVLGAYAFSVYLLSGQTEHVTKFLHAASAGRKTARASKVVLGLPLPDLDIRFRRWLQETR